MNDYITAYRVWRLYDGHKPTLGAWGRSFKWPLGRMTATCVHNDPSRPEFNVTFNQYSATFARNVCRHVPLNAPVNGCQCGIYAFKGLDLVGEQLLVPTGCTIPHVAGRVALWGRIIECDRGYKAQYAYPQVLFYTEATKDLVLRTADVYGCEAFPEPPEIIEAIAKEKERTERLYIMSLDSIELELHLACQRARENGASTITWNGITAHGGDSVELTMGHLKRTFIVPKLAPPPFETQWRDVQMNNRGDVKIPPPGLLGCIINVFRGKKNG